MQNEIIEAVLDYIDKNITENINIDLLAEKSGYSAYHFSRVFSETVGISLIAYVTWRKLQFALSDISNGEKIIDIAVKYGFETHGGFAKAFKKHFGFPPSLGILHVKNNQPCETNIETLQLKFKKGNVFMNPHIIELTPFTVAGRTKRVKIPNVQRTGDIPAFWTDPRINDHELLNGTMNIVPKSKHCEIYMCYETDINTDEITYLIGRGITHPDDMKNILPDMVTYEIKGSYAIFTTPPVSMEDWDKNEGQVVRETWNDILLKWLPDSEFEYDETRKDFEYYDYRCHGWYFDGKKQMDIFIPIRLREEARKKAIERSGDWCREEFKRAEELWKN